MKGARERGYGVCGHGLLCTRERCRSFPKTVKRKAKRMSDRDRFAVVSALLAPPAPGAALERAAKRYRRRRAQ